MKAGDALYVAVPLVVNDAKPPPAAVTREAAAAAHPGTAAAARAPPPPPDSSPYLPVSNTQDRARVPHILNILRVPTFLDYTLHMQKRGA